MFLNINFVFMTICFEKRREIVFFSNSFQNSTHTLHLISHSLYQIEASPQINQKKLIKFCQDRDIVVTAYCPLGRPIPAEKKPSFLYDDKLAAIAKKYNKTVPQVVFRYLVSQHKSSVLFYSFFSKLF